MDVFFVIADPTRRKMLEMMRAGERAAGEFVAEFPTVSQPAISQHLKVLRDAGLVSVRADRQRRLYSIRLEELASIASWIAAFQLNETSQAEASDATIITAERMAGRPKPKSRVAKSKIDNAPMTLDLFG